MGDLADQLGRLSVTVRSPDGQVTATLDGYGQVVDIGLDPRAYQRYSTTELERQLSQLGRLGYVAYRREHQRLTEAAFAHPVYEAAPDEVGPELRVYRQRVAALDSHGESSDGTVRITARGLADWEVSLAAELTRRISREAFLDRLRTAVTELFNDHNAQTTEVRRQVYEPVESDWPLRGDPAGGPIDRLRYQVDSAVRASSRTNR